MSPGARGPADRRDGRDGTVLTPAVLRNWALRAPGGGKEGRGRVLVVGGCTDQPGGVMLAGEAAMRAGAGKLQLATARTVSVAVGVAMPEALSVGLPVDDEGQLTPAGGERIVELARDCDAVLLGPGMGSPATAEHLLAEVVPHLDCVTVIDALGLAYLTGHLDRLSHLPGRAVLTPNPKELARTLGVEPQDVDDDPVTHARRLAEATGAVVMAGAATAYVVTAEGDVWIDESGSPGLGVSGSGDVKAGIVAGLVARGADPAQAAVWASYSHGRSGERLAARVGANGFLARELLGEVPQVLVELDT